MRSGKSSQTWLKPNGNKGFLKSINDPDSRVEAGNRGSEEVANTHRRHL